MKKFHNKGGTGFCYKFNGNILRFGWTLCYYLTKDGDIIDCPQMIYVRDPYIKETNTHICQISCKRYIPDEYKDCDEWMSACSY